MSTFIGAAAVGVTLFWWLGGGIDALLVGYSVASAPWTLITSILPHIDPVHLAFNLYWWWRFATRIEAAWGSAPLLGATLLLAIISSAAEAAAAWGGVGLSGVVYGLFAALFVLRRDARFAGVISQQVALLFVAWFFLCIAMTYLNLWQVGNVAHGSGAVAGWLLGLAVTGRGVQRRAAITGLAIFGVAAIGGATVGRPWVNPWARQHHDALAGWEALQRNDFAAAITPLESAVQRDPADSTSHESLGYAYFSLGRHDEALRHYKRAAELDPALRAEHKEWIAETLARQAWHALSENEVGRAKSLASEAAAWDEKCGRAWLMLGHVRRREDEPVAAISAFESARMLLPIGEYPTASYLADAAGAEMAARRYGEAAKRWQKLIELRPEEPEHWFYLGECLRELGEKDGAMAAFEKARGSATVGEQAREAMERLGRE